MANIIHLRPIILTSFVIVAACSQSAWRCSKLSVIPPTRHTRHRGSGGEEREGERGDRAHVQRVSVIM